MVNMRSIINSRRCKWVRRPGHVPEVATTGIHDTQETLIPYQNENDDSRFFSYDHISQPGACIHVNPERSFGGTNEELSSEGSQLWKKNYIANGAILVIPELY